jgi:hypothetical protein
MSGSTYASKRPENQRPKNNLYHTPFSLVWELLKVEEFNNVLEPACGKGAISRNLIKAGIKVTSTDITKGKNFLKRKGKWNGDIITNPPFDIWDDFVNKAKSLKPRKICFIGKVNFFGTHGRNVNGIWKRLSKIYIFDRMVDYQTPYRTDGFFHVGSLVTGWFIWEAGYKGKPQIEFIDVSKYAKLGLIKKRSKKSV